MSEGTQETQYALNALKMEVYVVELFSKLTKHASNEGMKEKLTEFVEEERGHVSFWREFLSRRNVSTDHVSFSGLRLRFELLLANILGLGFIYKLMERSERVAIRSFATMLTFDSISEEEKRGIRELLYDELRHEEQFEEYEKLYRFYIDRVQTILTQVSGGLVNVMSISIGVTGISQDPFTVGITGLIVGLASSVNTFTLFYFLARTQRYVKEKILNRVKVAIEIAPDLYSERVSKYMRGRAFTEETSNMIASEARENPLILERIIADEEYGIKPEALGNPYQTALYSAIFRIIGTVTPLIPYFMGFPVIHAIPISVAITLMMLACVGVLVALFAEIDIMDKVIDLTTSGLVLASLTFVIGKLATIIRAALL